MGINTRRVQAVSYAAAAALAHDQVQQHGRLEPVLGQRRRLVLPGARAQEQARDRVGGLAADQVLHLPPKFVLPGGTTLSASLDLARTIEKNIARIPHMQLADNPGRNEPGTGEIQYAAVHKYIYDLGYRGWIGLECTPKGDPVAAARAVARTDQW